MRTRARALRICILSLIQFGCGQPQETLNTRVASSSETPRTVSSPSRISEEAAVRIAKDDFVRLIGPLDNVKIEGTETPEDWQISFRRVSKDLLEGGLVTYTVDKKTGKILNKKLYQ
jgi:hypothetical protein